MATTNKNFRIKNGLEVSNAIGVGSNGSSFGTAGQILSSNGTASPAVWIDNYTTDVRHTVINNTGSTLYKGQAVYITNAGNSSDTPRIALAQANAESTSSKTLGLLMQNLTQGSTGFVIASGLLTGVDTTGGNAGDAVWLSYTTAGGLVFGNPPTKDASGPMHMVYLGVVGKENQNQGSIIVKVQNGYELGEGHDVYIANTSTTNDILIRNANSMWVNANFATANIANLAQTTLQTFAGPITITGNANATTFNGSGAGLTNIPNSALVNNSITINGNAIALGGSVTIAGSGASYNVSADSVSGGANITLNGSDASTDAVTILGGNATTVTYANANAITINTTPVVASGTAPSSTDVIWVDTGNNASATIPSSTLTTKGDLITATGNNTPVRLGVGSDGQVLIANSSATSGLSWGTASSSSSLGKVSSSLSTGYYPIYEPTNNVSSNATGASATIVYLCPYYAMSDMTMTSISISATGTVSSTVRLGLYAAQSNGMPGDRIGDYGTVSTATAGVKTITGLSVNITAGTLYYFALVNQTTSSVFLHQKTNANQTLPQQMIPLPNATGTTASQTLAVSIPTTGGALPSTAVGATFTNRAWAYLFWIGV